MNIKSIKSKQDFDAYINRTPYQQLMQDYYETILGYQQLLNQQPQRIKLTVGQFLNMFEIQGMKIMEDGELIEQLETEKKTRGRKKTILTDEDKAAQAERRREYQRQRYHQLKDNKGEY